MEGDDLTKAGSDRRSRHTESVPNYRPFAARRPSTQYQDMLRTIRDDGVHVHTKQGEDALAIAGVQMRFPMAHGAAVITERSIGGVANKERRGAVAGLQRARRGGE